MTATAHISIVLSGDDTFQHDAQSYGDGAIGSVRINPTRQALHIQSQDPAALRRLADALNDAAAKAEQLIDRRVVTAEAAS